MIFITLGTQKFQFNRILEYIDEKNKNGEINEEIYAQIGYSDYIPSSYKFKKFLDRDEFENYIEKADIIITHSGVGTIITAITKNKSVIVVPRLSKYGEHVDNHQLEIADSFSRRNFVISNGEDINNLLNNIKLARNYKFNKYISSNNQIQNIIIDYIEKDLNKKIDVLMLGSDLSVKGGIVSVIRNYLEYKNWKDIQIKFIPTHKDGNKIHKIFYFLTALIKIDFNLIFKKYDVAHIHVSERGSIFRKNMIINHIRLFSKNTKIILHHHGAEFNDFYETLNLRKKKKIQKMLKTVDINIVLSKKLIDSIQNKQPESKVEVLYNAVNTYSKNMYNTNGNIILFLGRLCERKGIYDFLDVIKEIKEKLEKNNIQVYLCGDGQIEEIKEIVKKNNLNSIIRHIGWIKQKEKEEIFKKCIINVLPSYNEGLPMTILETMSYGIPNISTNIASIPEVIENEKNGYLINPGDKEKMKLKILELIDNKEKRVEISENAYNTIVNKFSLDKNIEKLKLLYMRKEK